jgi:hypothetical protein
VQARELNVGAIVIILLVACSKPALVNAGDIPGMYVLTYNNQIDSLQIISGGEYQHRRWNNTVPAVSESGHWALSNKEKRPAVEFANFTALSIRPGAESLRGFWLTTIGRDRTGRVILEVNPDLGLNYRRTN